nr:MAG TPA: hypothetical protein [Caudoviricetes sp.]
MRSSVTMLDKQTCLLPSRDKAMNHRHHPFIQEISHHLFTFLRKYYTKRLIIMLVCFNLTAKKNVLYARPVELLR